jgi:hypothetical protein
MVEEIEPAGIISDENDEIGCYVADYRMKGLDRISFWKSSFTAPNESVCRDELCIGYAILKHDTAPSRNYDKWHIFEAVFKKYPHEHNCVPRPMQYEVALGKGRYRLDGLLYAQQNELNKACAQVALRSLISRVNQSDISYRRINELAQSQPTPGFDPANGLETGQIRSVLEKLGIRFRDFDYTQHGEAERQLHPYQKYVYAGVESGAGALVGFHLTGPAAQSNQRHIIPFYGHTFNKDTWAPEADIVYFHVGETLGYVPSEYWTSSFLGHDDNFGPNFCVPRLYIRPEQVEYVVELLKPGIMFGGAQAEALSLQFLYSVLGQIETSGNVWLNRLAYFAQPEIQRIVLRAVAIDRTEYIKHLATEKDWEQNSENPKVIEVLHKFLPYFLWIVEVSIPQLFPANERKLGDIVLNGGVQLNPDQQYRSHFLFARLPSLYFFRSEGRNFLSVPSNLKSHLSVIRLR